MLISSNNEFSNSSFTYIHFLITIYIPKRNVNFNFISDQTCDKGSECIFSHYMDLDHYLRWCSEGFGLEPDNIMRSASFTNAYYGSDHPKGTRIVFVNGISVFHFL